MYNKHWSLCKSTFFIEERDFKDLQSGNWVQNVKGLKTESNLDWVQMHLLPSCGSQHARLDRLDDLTGSICGSKKRSSIPPPFHTLLIWGNTHYLSRWHRAFGFVTQKVERGLGSTWIGMVDGVGLGWFPKNGDSEACPESTKSSFDIIWLHHYIWIFLHPSSDRSDPRSYLQHSQHGLDSQQCLQKNDDKMESTGLSTGLVRILAFEVQRLCHLCQCNSQHSQRFTVSLYDVLRDMNYI